MELVEARISLEVPLAGLAAQHATDETAEQLLAAIAEARGQRSRLGGVPDRRHAFPPRDRDRGAQRAAAGVHELDARRAAAVADRHDRRVDRRRRDPRSAPRDPARDPPAPARRRPARDAPAPRLPARARRDARAGSDFQPEEGTVKAALMRAYHQPLEFVERPMPEIARPGDVVVRIGGAGVCATDLHAIEGLMEPASASRSRACSATRTRAGSRRSATASRRSRRRRGARLPAVQLRALRPLPPRQRHALRAPRVHGSDGRRRLRRLRPRRRALAPAPARRCRAGGGRAACGRRAHGVPRRAPARAPVRPRHHRRRDRRRRCRSHRAAAPARARRELHHRDRDRPTAARPRDRARRGGSARRRGSVAAYAS